MKKKLLIIFAIIISVFVILFTIQIIDQKLNGEDYKSVRIFGNQVKATIKDGTACTNDLDILFNTLLDDTYKQEKISIDNKFLEKKINACYSLSDKIKQIPVPKVKSKHKRKLMIKSKNDFAYYFSEVADNLKIYLNCDIKNSEYLDDFNITSLKEYNDLSLNLMITSLDIYLDYSIKDIILTRPLILYLKYLNK